MPGLPLTLWRGWYSTHSSVLHSPPANSTSLQQSLHKRHLSTQSQYSNTCYAAMFYHPGKECEHKNLHYNALDIYMLQSKIKHTHLVKTPTQWTMNITETLFRRHIYIFCQKSRGPLRPKGQFDMHVSMIQVYSRGKIIFWCTLITGWLRVSFLLLLCYWVCVKCICISIDFIHTSVWM